MSNFEIYPDDAGQYRWRLRDDSGDIVAVGSRGNDTREDCYESIETVKRFFYETHARYEYETYEDAAGDRRWRFSTGDGHVLARGTKAHADPKACREAMTRAALEAVGASITDKTARRRIASGPSSY